MTTKALTFITARLTPIVALCFLFFCHSASACETKQEFSSVTPTQQAQFVDTKPPTHDESGHEQCECCHLNCCGSACQCAYASCSFVVFFRTYFDNLLLVDEELIAALDKDYLLSASPPLLPPPIIA